MSTRGKGRRALLPAVGAVALAVLGVVLLQPVTPPTAGSGQAGSDLAQTAAQSSTEPASPTTQAPSPSTAAECNDGGEDAPTWEPGQEPWRPTATGFLTDFAQPGRNWVARITRWTAPSLAAQYTDVDPTGVPSATLVNLEVVAAGESLVDVAATYDDGHVLLVRIENSAQAWQVTRVEPAASQDG